MRNRSTVGRDSPHTNNLITRVPIPCQRLQPEFPGLIFTPRNNGFIVIGVNGEKYVAIRGCLQRLPRLPSRKN